MSVVDELAAEIDRDVGQRLSVDERGDVEFPPWLFDELGGAELDALLAPEVDVVEDEPPPPGDRLGCYVRMRSPGMVVLYREPLRRFFWAVLAGSLRGLPSPVVRRSDLRALASAVVRKTYEHERLHHSCEVLGHLLGRVPQDRYREEALAVAYSRRRLEVEAADRRTVIGSMSGGLRARALDVMFAYRSPGYRDWPRYATTHAFRQGLLDHLAPPAGPFLVAAGVAVPDLLHGLLPINDGFREVLI